MLKKQQELTIGTLANYAGVNVETVRYYQRKGLVDTPPKPLQGFRHYSKKTVERIKFIKRAQRLGFSLKEIADLLELGTGNCQDVKIQAEKKRDLINNQILDLELLRNTLTQLITECGSSTNHLSCPIVETLLAHDIV